MFMCAMCMRVVCICTCVCVCVTACVCVHMQRSEVDTWNLPWLLFHVIHCIGVSVKPRLSHWSHWLWGSHLCRPKPEITRGLPDSPNGIQTLIPMLVQKALYPLSPLPGPSTFFFEADLYHGTQISWIQLSWLQWAFSPHPWPLEWQAVPTVPGFYLGARDLNSGSHAFAEIWAISPATWLYLLTQLCPIGIVVYPSIILPAYESLTVSLEIRWYKSFSRLLGLF